MVTEYQSDLAHGLNGTGYMLDVLGQKAEAMELHRRVLLIRERRRRQIPRSPSTATTWPAASSTSAASSASRDIPPRPWRPTTGPRATLEQLVREHPAAPAYRFALERRCTRWPPSR